MKRIVSFALVFVATTLAWLLLGYLIRLVFPSLSMMLFLILGVAGGLLLASLLAFMHEDPVQVPGSLPHSSSTPSADPRPPRPGINPNAGGEGNLL